MALRLLGGERRSARIEAHSGLILELLDQQPDITLKEIQATLEQISI